MISIEKELSNISGNFTDEKFAVKCHSIEEKQAALRIFREHYKYVEARKGKTEYDDNGELTKPTWIIQCSTPFNGDDYRIIKHTNKNQDALHMSESYLIEGGDWDLDETDPDEVLEDDMPDEEYDNDEDLNLDQFDDPDDDLDMSDENFDTIDDISEVSKAEKLTVLKKKASDLGEKWKEVYKQIVDLARYLDLEVSHDDDLKIELKKTNGKPAKIGKDLNNIKQELDTAGEEGGDSIDDDFGPSEYDARASELSQTPDEPYQESLNQPQNLVVNESINSNNSFVSTSEELYLSADEVDDEM